jgi:hypothetical protein
VGCHQEAYEPLRSQDEARRFVAANNIYSIIGNRNLRSILRSSFANYNHVFAKMNRLLTDSEVNRKVFSA